MYDKAAWLLASQCIMWFVHMPCGVVRNTLHHAAARYLGARHVHVADRKICAPPFLRPHTMLKASAEPG